MDQPDEDTMTTPNDPADQLDDRIPVTVMLTPSQSARLEVLIADIRSSDPSIDDNDVADAAFEMGLCGLETSMKAPHHEPAL
jgi:hypothetical protein